MRWSVNDILLYTKFLTRKNRSISASDLFYAWNAEQSAYQSDLLGKWQNRNNGKTGANIGLIQDETIMTILSPFVINTIILVVGDQVTKPDDFIYGLARRLRVDKSTDKLITKINHGQIYYVQIDVIDPPSIADGTYYMVEYQDYYTILPHPAAGSLLVLDYVPICRDIKWGYSFDADGRQVYNSGTSVQPQWATPTIQEITRRTLAGFGVSFKDSDFEQFGKTNIITGDS